MTDYSRMALKCKICKSGLADSIEFERFYLQFPYRVIIDIHGEAIDGLSGYNLSNHLNFHTRPEVKRFWRELRERIDIYELSPEESNEIYERMKARLEQGCT